MKRKDLAYGVYYPTENFRNIEAHSCVCDANSYDLVAVTGRAEDEESQEYAELFANAFDTLDALTTARARIAELEAALANLRDTIVKLNPQIPSEIDGDPYCFFCGEWYGAHREDCLWRITFNETGK